MVGLDIGRVGIWSAALDGVSSAEARRAVEELEASGLRTLWIPETVGRDPFVTATLLLGATSSLRVATGIANIYARDAVTMANTQRALAEAFPDRFLLGLGVSHLHLVDRVRKHDYSKPYSRMVSYLDEMEQAVFRGVGPVELGPRVLAALGPRMLSLAGARAAGAHTYFVPVEHTASARALLGPQPLLAPEQMVVLDRDRTRAHEVARRGMTPYVRAPNYVQNLERFGFTGDDVVVEHPSDRLVDAIVACGGVEAAVERVRAHLDAGADHVAVQVLTDGASLPLGEWRELLVALAEL